MPYEMVPVPEEHVQDVMQFILREMAKASLEPWDDESVSKLFHEVDESSRSLLAYTARASLGANGGCVLVADLMHASIPVPFVSLSRPLDVHQLIEARALAAQPPRLGPGPGVGLSPAGFAGRPRGDW